MQIDELDEAFDLPTPILPTIRVRRLKTPRWAKFGSDAHFDRDAYRRTGEQAQWGWGIPWTYRALASPSTGEPMPAAPTPGAALHAATGYWAALLHLLLFSLGWNRPDRGLDWIRRNDFSDEPDVRVHLIRQVWVGDGQIDFFHTWLRNVLAEDGWGLESATALGPLSTSFKPTSDPHLTATLMKTAHRRLLSTPLGGGDSDALHLTRHCRGPLEEPYEGVSEVETLSAPATSRAVLITDSAMGWYSALMRYGQQLKSEGISDPAIDVVVRPIGWLGRFEQSPQTAIWYSGPHHLHLVGT